MAGRKALLSPQRLNRLASAAFGPRWKRELARAVGVRNNTVLEWASGDLRVSDKSAAIIVALCVSRARANLSEALKVRAEVRLAEKRSASSSSRPPSVRRSWHEARGLPEPSPKRPKPDRRFAEHRKMLAHRKPRARRAPSEKQLAYWASGAATENIAKGRAVNLARRRAAKELRTSQVPTSSALGVNAVFADHEDQACDEGHNGDRQNGKADVGDDLPAHASDSGHGHASQPSRE